MKKWRNLVVVGLLGLGACSSVTTSDTYCRDTFFITTSKQDTAKTKEQIDKHNSRRLCRCNEDCE